MKIKFSKDPIDVEQSNNLTKIVSFYIVYELMIGQKLLLII